PAGGEYFGNATLAVLDGVGVDPDAFVVQRFDSPYPVLTAQLGQHIGTGRAEPEDPARGEVFDDQRAGLTLVEQPAAAQDADLVGHPLYVGEDVAGEDDGPLAPHGSDEVEDLGPPGRVER